MTIYLLNDEPSNSGIGRYTYAISRVLGSPRTLSMVKDKRKRLLFYPGEVFNGFFPPLTTGWGVNFRFQNLILKKMREKISVIDIIHYGNPHIIPVRENANDIITFYDFYFEEFSRNNSFVAQTMKNLRSYLNYEMALAISNRTADAARQMGFKGDLTVIYPPVSDTVRFEEKSKNLIKNGREKMGLPVDKILVLSISSEGGNKNIGFMEQLAQNLIEEHSQYSFVKVGSPIKGAINMKQLDEAELSEVYNLVDVYVQPSLDEGFCLPVVEAMKAGVPVVASDIPIFREITKGAAILKNLDISDFIEGIEVAASERTALSKKGLEVASQYSFEEFSNSLTHFYSQVVE